MQPEVVGSNPTFLTSTAFSTWDNDVHLTCTAWGLCSPNPWRDVMGKALYVILMTIVIMALIITLVIPTIAPFFI